MKYVRGIFMENLKLRGALVGFSMFPSVTLLKWVHLISQAIIVMNLSESVSSSATTLPVDDILTRKFDIKHANTSNNIIENGLVGMNNFDMNDVQSYYGGPVEKSKHKKENRRFWGQRAARDTGRRAANAFRVGDVDMAPVEYLREDGGVIDHTTAILQMESEDRQTLIEVVGKFVYSAQNSVKLLFALQRNRMKQRVTMTLLNFVLSAWNGVVNAAGMAAMVFFPPVMS
ncbi:hypothetical protein GE061_014747 [Apolygus lucorum]|uniref:Uncharacterized protein n=1 Tax=Apolygus lucorum TaxID=248454 RepID=A0A8S9XKA8_APOLU|nr:hypothetical protein GE061_014747 [Apolygus lucorum]